MKKLIATVIAVGALAAGGTASAQDFGSVIANLFGWGTPAYNQPYGYGTPSYSYGTPAVVASSQVQIYSDAYGRQFYYDQYGRQVYLQTTQQQIVGYDTWGRPIYGTVHSNTGQYAYGGSTYGSTYGSTWDRDGDGIANTRDRWPNDPRYW